MSEKCSGMSDTKHVNIGQNVRCLKRFFIYTRPTLNKKLVPVQRVPRIKASREAGKSYFCF